MAGWGGSSGGGNGSSRAGALETVDPLMSTTGSSGGAASRHLPAGPSPGRTQQTGTQQRSTLQKQPSKKQQQQQQQQQQQRQAPTEMPPELTEAVEQVVTHMASKDWRERWDALRALAALAPAAPALTEGGLDALVGALAARMADGNAKVQQQAIEVRGWRGGWLVWGMVLNVLCV